MKIQNTGQTDTAQLVLKAEEIAIKAHRFQPYREHCEENSYFIHHLQVVRENAVKICGKTSCNIHEAEITALLHDILEDTPEDKNELESIFGKKIMDAVELLTIRDETKMEEYFTLIGGNELARLVKAADRIANVSAISGITDPADRLRRYNKYTSQMTYFRKNNIFPEEVDAVFKQLDSRLRT